MIESEDREVEAAAGNVQSPQPRLAGGEDEDREQQQRADEAAFRPSVEQQQEAEREFEPRQRDGDQLQKQFR